jgi:membrane dipeptidase
MPEAREMHDSAIVIDTHADTFARVLDERKDFFSATNDLAITLPRMIEGGLDAQVFALYVAPGLPPGRTILRTLSMAGEFFQAAAASEGKLVFVQTVKELREAVTAGRKCGLLAVEGGHAIEADLNVLRSLRQMGVVSMTLTHANSNEWADSSQDVRRWGGLNDLGRDVVREMNRLRMLIDVSHASDETVEDVLEVSEYPVIASHSCCWSICKHPRNLTNELIRKIAKRGGVVHIAYYPPYLDQDAAAVFERNWDQLRGSASPTTAEGQHPNFMADLYARCMQDVPEVSIEKLCDHIDYVVALTGPEHVGLGSDWDGANVVVKGLETCAQLPSVTEELSKRGYTEREIRLILGENFLRLLEEVVGQ